MNKIWNLILSKIGSWFIDQVGNLLIYLIDQLKNVVYSDIANLIKDVEKPNKGLDKMLMTESFEPRINNSGNKFFANDKLQKKMIALINNGDVQMGLRFLYITEKGNNRIINWVRPQAYSNLVINVFKKYKEMKEQQNG